MQAGPIWIYLSTRITFHLPPKQRGSWDSLLIDPCDSHCPQNNSQHLNLAFHNLVFTISIHPLNKHLSSMYYVPVPCHTIGTAVNKTSRKGDSDQAEQIKIEPRNTAFPSYPYWKRHTVTVPSVRVVTFVQNTLTSSPGPNTSSGMDTFRMCNYQS